MACWRASGEKTLPCCGCHRPPMQGDGDYFDDAGREVPSCLNSSWPCNVSPMYQVGWAGVKVMGVLCFDCTGQASAAVWGTAALSCQRPCLIAATR